MGRRRRDKLAGIRRTQAAALAAAEAAEHGPGSGKALSELLGAAFFAVGELLDEVSALDGEVSDLRKEVKRLRAAQQ